MSEKIVLIDGHSILNRAFYGVPDLTNAEGLHTNAVYGFLNILFKIQEEEKPETPVEAPAVEAVEVTEVAATADAAPAAETKTTEEKTQQQA